MSRILIVDDEAAVREAVAATLAHAGLDCELTADAAAAREYLQQNPACPLVVADVMMPRTDGLTLLDAIVCDHPGLPVVMVSALHDLPVVTSAFRRGAFDFLLKPFQRTELLATVHRALEHHQAQQQNLTYRANLEELISERTGKLRATMLDLERSYDITLEAMGDALDLRDEETEGHSKRVTAYTIALARAFGVGDAQLKVIARGAFLHDIGKIATPDSILLKPGKLTAEEMAVMREHCARGYAIVRKIPFLADAAEIVYAHQESFDGSGYPRGLHGEEIPLGARLFAIADTLDAMTSDRPYRKGRSFQEAIAEIERCSGTQFDPAIVAVFLAQPTTTWSGIRAAIGKNSHASELLRVA